VASSVESERFAMTLPMAEEGLALMRANLRRAHPDEPEPVIEARLEAWLLDRPMDAPGRVIVGSLP